MLTLTAEDPLAVTVTEAIRTGDLPGLRRLPADRDPEVVAVRRVTGSGRTWRPASRRRPRTSPARSGTSAFWGACHGGHLSTAQYLHAHGADPHWRGYDGLTPLDVARGQGAGDVVRWLRGPGAAGAAEETASARPPASHRQ
ncbi:ankyrin repeat domain-containing protein [Streptomyces sp. NPDC004135]